MQVDDPPYLSVGTAVSAKYKGAFCEAKVSKVVRIVKCKVTYKMGLGNATVSDEQIKGTLRVGHTVQAKHPERKEFVEATITKIQDCSQYTVVFDDGDITTLRRSALCLKSGRHFNESETLDQLPLTHPEHFGNPVVGGRRGRRNRQLKDDSSEGEAEEENEPDLEGYSTDIGRVVSVEATDKKRGKDNWFPGLVVIPSAQPTVRINVKDEYLVRSFKDGRYYTVPKKEVSEFNRELGEKVESTVLAEAVGKALRYLDHNELPVHWERNSLFNMQSLDSDSDENYSDSSDDEPNEEKDRFVAQLYKFMDDSGTPLNKSPMIANKDVDLHKLFRITHKLGGYNRVTNQNKWRSVTTRMKLPTNQITYNQVKSVYKKCLLSYEGFYRTLGVTMLNHTRSTKKNRGRSLIRDKDRTTPINSPKPDKDDDGSDKKEDDNKSGSDEKSTIVVVAAGVKKKSDDKAPKRKDENSDTNSGDATDQSESVPSSSKEIARSSKRIDKSKEKKIKSVNPLDKKKDEDEKQMQQTRSKSLAPKLKEILTSDKKKDTSSVKSTTETASKSLVAATKPAKKVEEDKKRGRKKSIPDDKDKPGVEIVTDSTVAQQISIGDKLKVYYGPTHESKVTYEAKVIEIDKDSTGPVYLVHYTGWNTRYDEWIAPNRIAENLSASTKAKRQKQPANSTVAAKSKTAAAKRGRGMSITGRSTAVEGPRSTTPSSVTSSSSRTKSPATPATRSTSRMTRQADYGRKTRRASAQTDNSNHSESDSDISESESESCVNKSAEVEIKTYRKRIATALKSSANKDDKSKDKIEQSDDKDKDEESLERPKRTRRIKRNIDDSDEDSINPPKGRDFDLNQIRSELKGFTKAIKVASPEAADKEASSSSDDLNTVQNAPKIDIVEDRKDPKLITIEQSPSSEDIYEFKEPEPFEFEARTKITDDKASKKRIPRLFEDLDKSPKCQVTKSPRKTDKDSPETSKKPFRRTTPVKKDELTCEDEKKDEDPFDKLVESPSFNLIKSSDKPVENKLKVTRNILEEEPLSLFQELPETMDDYSHDMDLSDCESQTQPIFSREGELFPDSFSKPIERNTLDLEFPKDDIKKSTDDFASIRESINRAIQASSSDECDNLSDDDLRITPSTSSYQGKKRDTDNSGSPPQIKTNTTEEDKSDVKVEEDEEEEEEDKKNAQISPALQETDSSLLESICGAQPVSIQAKLEEAKDLNLKKGPKVADSILRKFNSIKNKVDKSENSDSELDVKKEELSEDETKVKIEAPKVKPTIDLKVKTSETEAIKKSATPPIKSEILQELTNSNSSSNNNKKKRKVLSKAFIEESDSDSSDSEQLVIARTDEDSQTTSFIDKNDTTKESDSNISAAQIATTDDSQSQEEQRNFNFDKVTTGDENVENKSKIVAQVPPNKEPPVLEAGDVVNKDEEPDSQLHSLLLCDETIPRSPAPVVWEAPAVQEVKLKPKSVLEMPFASAPGSSDNKLIAGDSKLSVASKAQTQLAMPVASANRDRAATNIDNTPPTTPESSMSNSPRGDNDDLSPNTAENESCKSNDAEADYPRKRRNSSIGKVPAFSEDDSQTTNEPSPSKKPREDTMPASCKKRRKSARGADEVPAKRGRKPLNRSRHNSDSDDTSEHSVSGPASITLGLSIYDRTSKSPRPSKYNFFVEFDPSLNSGQRIAVLQQKLTEIRKTYAEVKAELAAVERRRKKIRRREREALKASKQEMVCG